MNNLYIAYDDLGTILLGTKEDCLKSIVSWAESAEAEEHYSEDDLVLIIDFFNQSNYNSEIIAYSGFIVSKIKG